MSGARALGVSVPVSPRTWALLVFGCPGFRFLCFRLTWRLLPALRPSGRVAVEDEVAILGDRVAGKAGVVHRLAGGLAVVEVSEAPAAGGGVLGRVLDHELDPILG